MNYANGKNRNWLLLLLTVTVLVLALTSACFSESKKDDGKGKKKEISKEDTIAYIQARCTVDNDNAKTKDSVRVEGCTLITETEGYGENADYSHSRTAPLDKLNPESPTPGVWPSTNGVKFGLVANSVSYTTADEKPHIRFVADRKAEKFHIDQMNNYGYFQCEGETAAKQAAKALKHLIQLCGGAVQKDLFDDVKDKEKKDVPQKGEFGE